MTVVNAVEILLGVAFALALTVEVIGMCGVLKEMVDEFVKPTPKRSSSPPPYVPFGSEQPKAPPPTGERSNVRIRTSPSAGTPRAIDP
jgi:hypothetical protein